jgi:protein-tyrosine phosphatase
MTTDIGITIEHPSILITKGTASLNCTSNKINWIRKEAAFYDLVNKNGNLRVYISQTPTESSIEPYIEFMIDDNITDIFNFCHNADSTPYSYNSFIDRGIDVHHLAIDDGGYPSIEIIKQFNKAIDKIIAINNKKDLNQPVYNRILFHCQAGMGRAPTMLAYLMISRFRYHKYNDRADIVYLIRSKRRGAFNRNQLDWVLHDEIKEVGEINAFKGCINCVLL